VRVAVQVSRVLVGVGEVGLDEQEKVQFIFLKRVKMILQTNAF
jgi:hypothetical protein